jgi:hypothetical protein
VVVLVVAAIDPGQGSAWIDRCEPAERIAAGGTLLPEIRGDR